MSFYLVAGHGASTAAPQPGAAIYRRSAPGLPVGHSDTEWDLSSDKSAKG